MIGGASFSIFLQILHELVESTRCLDVSALKLPSRYLTPGNHAQVREEMSVRALPGGTFVAGPLCTALIYLRPPLPTCYYATLIFEGCCPNSQDDLEKNVKGK